MAGPDRHLPKKLSADSAHPFYIGFRNSFRLWIVGCQRQCRDDRRFAVGRGQKLFCELFNPFALRRFHRTFGNQSRIVKRDKNRRVRRISLAHDAEHDMIRGVILGNCRHPFAEFTQSRGNKRILLQRLRTRRQFLQVAENHFAFFSLAEHIQSGARKHRKTHYCNIKLIRRRTGFRQQSADRSLRNSAVSGVCKLHQRVFRLPSPCQLQSKQVRKRDL